MGKLDILSFAKMQGYIFLLFGLLFGIFYSIGGLFIDLFVSVHIINSIETSGLGIGTIYAMGALVAMPLISFVIGFLFGLIGAILYNMSLRFITVIKSDIYAKEKGN